MVDIAEIKVQKLSPVETIRQITEIFSRREVTLQGSNSDLAAQQLKSEQTSIHKSAAGVIWARMKTRDNWLRRQNNALNSFIDENITVARFVNEASSSRDAARVMSTIAPVLQQEDINRLSSIFELTSLPEVEAGEIAVAAYLRTLRGTDSRNGIPDFENRISFAIARIEAVWALDQTFEGSSGLIGDKAEQVIAAASERYFTAANTVEGEVNRMKAETEKLAAATRIALKKTANVESKANDAQRNIDALTADFEDKFGTTEARANASIDAFREKMEAVSKSLEDHREAALAELEGFRSRSEEQLGLREAKKLWGWRALWAAISFWLSLTLILFSLIGTVAFAIFFSEEILSYINHIQQAVSVNPLATTPDTEVQPRGEIATIVETLARLVLVTAPLGFIIWAIRILVRFNMRSMLMMDDARQRVTMLNTYLFMVERDAGVKEDRAAILEALFRRAPGHGSDTVEPPSFTDLLRYGRENKAG